MGGGIIVGNWKGIGKEAHIRQVLTNVYRAFGNNSDQRHDSQAESEQVWHKVSVIQS